MIYLIHGEDSVSSKNFLLKLRDSYSSVEQISLKNIKNFYEVLPVGKGLFSTKKLVIIENFPLRKETRLPDKLDYDVVLWFDESVTPPSWVEKTWFFKGKSGNSSFALADSIAYGQEKQALTILKELLLIPREREMIVGSLARQMRLIALCLSGEVGQVSKSEFLRTKIAEQAKNWDFRKVRSALVYLLKADLWMKQGKLSGETLLTNLTIKLCQLQAS